MESPAKLPERRVYERAIASRRSALGALEFGAEYSAECDMALDVALDLTMAFTPSEAPGIAPELIGRLTERERDVLMAMMSGVVTNRAIAALFSISPKTAGNHVDRIMAKLGVNTRTAAFAVASRIGTTSTVPKTDDRAPVSTLGDSSP